MLCKIWSSNQVWLQKLTGHHQRTKSIEEINDYQKEKTSKTSWSRCTLGTLHNSSYVLNCFASHSVCATVAGGTTRWVMKFVDEVGSTIFYINICYVFAAFVTIIKADRSENLTIFHFRMSAIQPAWPVCTTSVCFHTRCWHFRSCSSHKTIPSRLEIIVTQIHSRVIFLGTYLPVGLIQVLVMVARIGYKVKLQLWQDFSH